jgi:transcriptional regulator
MATIRQKMIEALRKEELDAHDLSRILSIREKEVYEHLPHIVKSLEAAGEKLTIHPYVCLTCAYVFKDRSRLNRPGKCPRCKEGAIRMATYEIT